MLLPEVEMERTFARILVFAREPDAVNPEGFGLGFVPYQQIDVLEPGDSTHVE